MKKTKLVKRKPSHQQRQQLEKVKELLTVGSALAPEVGEVRRGPSIHWKDVKPDDLSGNFKTASVSAKQKLMARGVQERAQRAASELAVMDKQARAQWRAEQGLKRLDAADRHPFLNGNSPFIFYVMTVDVAALAKGSKTRRKPKPVTISNPISKPDRDKFVRQLKKAVDKTADFVWTELMPITSSVFTALAKVTEYSQQVLDVEPNLPTDFMIRKTTQAVELRVIRHLREQFHMTDEEYKLFTAEYRARLPGF